MGSQCCLGPYLAAWRMGNFYNEGKKKKNKEKK